MKKVTINSIAEYAGVSRGTVDRVLNERPHVSPDQRYRVLCALQDLGYIPTKEKHRKLMEEIASEIPRQTRFGIILPSEVGYFRDEICRGIEEARSRFLTSNVEVLTAGCSTQMPDEVLGYIADMQAKGIRGLAICAENDPRIVEAIKKLSGEGLPVITYNSDLPDSGRVCFIGQDPKAGGRLAGSLMSKMTRPGDELIAAIGNRRVHGHTQRLQGFLDDLTGRSYPLKTIHVAETFNDYQLSRQRIGELLKAHPNVKGIYMANHSVGGCAEALRAAGLTGKIHVISHDLTDSTRLLLANNETDFAITQDLAAQSCQALLALLELNRTGSIGSQDQRNGTMNIVCAENLSFF